MGYLPWPIPFIHVQHYYTVLGGKTVQGNRQFCDETSLVFLPAEKKLDRLTARSDRVRCVGVASDVPWSSSFFLSFSPPVD